MNDEQREIFSKVLDKNWEASQTKNHSVKFNHYKEVNTLLKELKESMGEEAYNKFIENGKAMFAPKV